MIPTDLSGCTVWLDASQLTGADGSSVGSQWADLSGNGNHGAVVGSPSPVIRAGANGLNGKRVVRFAVNEGRVRGGGMCTVDSIDITVIYVGRQWGPNVGRIFTEAYPPDNFLVGAHSSAEPAMYDNGWIYTPGGWGGIIPTPWRMYGAVASLSPRYSTFYVGGTELGSGVGGYHGPNWNLSGYDATGTQETCDCEVAELICYNRALSDAERVSVENYLDAKWIHPPSGVAVSASLSCSGVLVGSASARYAAAPALTAAGTLSATVKPIHNRTASFGSTGQLQITVTTVGEPPPPDPPTGGGWTNDPKPPVRRYGSDGWSNVATLPRPVPGSGWHALIQRVARLSGAGTLQFSMLVFIGKSAPLSGNGTLSNTMVPRGFRTIPTSANGVLVGEAWPVKALSVNLTSSGLLDFGGINEGLHGTVQVGYASRLNSEGTLTVLWVGGNPNYADGLTAVVVAPRYLIPGIFSSAGALTAFAAKLDSALTYLSAQGFLTASTTQVYPLVANLASTGQLSATTFFAYQKLVDLIGTGTLSATAFAAYLRSLGVSGAGALTALLVASYPSTASTASVGSVTATVSQVYSPTPALAAEGSLTASARPGGFDGLWGEVRKL